MPCFRCFIFIYLLLIFAFLPGSPLHADLADLSEAVTEEQKEKGDEDSEGSEEPPSNVDDETQSLWDGLFAVTGLLWYYHNASSWYPPYPYGTVGGYPRAVGHDLVSLMTEQKREHLKKGRLSLQAGAGGFFQGNEPGWTINAGASWMIGAVIEPVIEYRLWNDKSGYLHQLRGGATLPLVQSDYFSLGLSMAGVFFFDAFRLDGFAIGGVITTYPIEPLSLELRGGGILSSNTALGEFGLRLGWHTGRTKIFAGYYGLYHSQISLNAFELGAGVYY